MWVQSLDGEDPLEEGMATHSSTLAWTVSIVSPSISQEVMGRDAMIFFF